MDAHLFLAASLLPLAVGPPIARWAERSATATATLDAFVAVTVGGISLLHVLPHAYAGAGAMALLAMALGFVLPLGLGHHHGGGPWKKRPAVILVAFLGLGVHATLDGLALVGPRAEISDRAGAAAGEMPRHDPASDAPDPGHDHRQASASLLAAAVILHRLPMALAIWWIAAPSLGRRVAAGLLAMIGAATVAGFAVGGRVWGLLSSPGLAVLQAAIAGMLLHMVLGHHEHHTDEPLSRLSRGISTLGVVAGVALLGAMTVLHPFEQRFPDELTTESAFLALALASAPALLLSYFVIALIYGFAPAKLRTLWLESPRKSSADVVDRRSPMSTCALLVLRPEVQLPVLALSLTLLGPLLTAWRVLAILAIAGLAVLSARGLLDGEDPKEAESPPSEPAARRSPTGRPGLGAGLRFGFGIAFDRTMPWILVGLGVAAFLEPMTGFADFRPAREPAQIAFLAILGIPFYFLGLGATPIVAVLSHKGVWLGGLLAFLCAGVAVSGARRLKPAFGRRAAWGFAARMLVLAFIASYALDLPIPARDLHGMANGGPEPVAVLAGFGLLALTVASIFRQGFRRFLRASTAMEKWHGAGL